MCGFAALFQPNCKFDPKLLEKMNADLFHRGPDSGDVVEESGFALIVRRLAIMDPRTGADQPMSDPTGRYTLAYNGEIYNYLDLRKELIGRGVLFKTTGDTEVLLQGFMAWGEEVVDKLEGMYAFAIVDRLKNRAVVARDPFGIKPLYLLRKGNLVAVASEMRPLTRLHEARPDPVALAELLCFAWAAGRLSNLKGIERVPGGTVLSIDLKSGSCSERRFCDPLDTLQYDESLSAGDARERSIDAISSSIRTHLQSDVGYAVQLSGGVDSSLVAAMTSLETDGHVTTFGVSLGGSIYDEGIYREKVVERYGMDHHEINLDGESFADALPRACFHMEGPVPHGGCVMLMLLCDEIRKMTKVVLTGEGADEFFGGYERHVILKGIKAKERIGRILPQDLWPKFWPLSGIRYYAGIRAAAFSSSSGLIADMEFLFPGLILKPGFREEVSARFSNFQDRVYAVDQSAYLESLLLRQDKMAMAASVETRVPFTHYPLACVLNKVPRNVLVDGKTPKPILKKIAEKYLPDDLLYRRKNGFLLPYDEWLSDPKLLGRYLDDLISSGSRLAAFGDPGRINKLIENFRSGRKAGWKTLFRLINVETWLRGLPNGTANL